MTRVVRAAGGLEVALRGSQTRPRARGLVVGGTRAIAHPSATAVEARRGDRTLWRRHWVCDGRLVIDFIDVGLVEVGDDNVVWFEQALRPDVEDHLMLDHILPLVLSRDGSLVLHGGLISLDGRGAVIIGASGAGKSTLTAHAWLSGWTVGGDDGAVLLVQRPVLAEPTYPTIRLTPASADLLGIPVESRAATLGKQRLGDESSFSSAPVELRTVVFLESLPSGADATCRSLSGAEAHAALFGSAFHAELMGARLLAVVDNLAVVVESVGVHRLGVPRGLTGLQGAERILRSLLGNAP